VKPYNTYKRNTSTDPSALSYLNMLVL